METYNMKAVQTFYGTGGYIVAGQEFFTTSKAHADFLVNEGKAVYQDESMYTPPEEQDLKLQAKARQLENEDQTEFKTSVLERNVTSMANPINLKIAVQGVNPEDLNIEVVRDQEVETKTVSVPEENKQEQPQQNQAMNQNYQQQSQPNYHTQNNVQPYKTQDFRAQNEKQQSSNQSNEIQSLEEQEQKLIEELHRLQQRQSQLRQSDNQQPASQQHEGSFEVRHVGGGWYDLPNGERVQGKENAEARMQEIQSASQEVQKMPNASSNPAVGRFQPNAERVRQANTQPEDGASLNQAQVESFNNSFDRQSNQQGSLSNQSNEGEFRGNASGSTSNTQGGGTGGADTSGNTGGNTGGNAGGTGGANTSGNTGQ